MNVGIGAVGLILIGYGCLGLLKNGKVFLGLAFVMRIFEACGNSMFLTGTTFSSFFKLDSLYLSVPFRKFLRYCPGVP